MHGLWTRIISSVVELGVDIADSPAMSFQGRDVQPNSYRTRLTWHLKSTPKRNREFKIWKAPVFQVHVSFAIFIYPTSGNDQI